MKIFKNSILVLMAVMAISLTSCKKDDDGGGGGGATSGTVKAKVAGANYESDASLTSAIRTDASGTSSVTITANTMNGKNISLSIISGFEGVGSYNIGGGANVFVNASYTEVDVSNPMDAEIWSAPYDESVAGEINVSEVSTTNIKGTFNFKGKNADGSFKEITEGLFDVNFQ
ncbi:DUF6252 family protein [Aequorivita sp. SDUM287046]|uniref:DUF6252 family protein n=1 Tax=Aequorivita aurantiaca TaxID=3053356 RepID=A0ABT8DG85_9FLAO|nr:DUF6252 family protein [Aequorivita aurantiaca]MDN3724380.1 DUF6252 family protein [Aequorivita aurantiaca]